MFDKHKDVKWGVQKASQVRHIERTEFGRDLKVCVFPRILVNVSIAVIKYHNLKQLGEEVVCFIYISSTVMLLKEVGEGTQTG